MENLKFPEDYINKVICGDCREVMRGIIDESVDLIVTSPPYGNLKTNQPENPKNLENYSFAEQLPLLLKVWNECYRVLRGGRKFCLNVGDIPFKSEFGMKWVGIPYRIVPQIEEIGFDLNEIIIWEKIKPRRLRFCGTAPYPPSPVLSNNFEHIFIFRKHGRPDYSYISKERRKESEFRMNKEYIPWRLCIWKFPTMSKKRLHEASFNIGLPHRLIKLYSFIDDIILDPFLGSGTTAVVCKELNRRFVGIEINPNYVKIANKRLEQEPIRNWIEK